MDELHAMLRYQVKKAIGSLRAREVLYLFGEVIGWTDVEWFRARRRHPELRLAGPKGRLP